MSVFVEPEKCKFSDLMRIVEHLINTPEYQFGKTELIDLLSEFGLTSLPQLACEPSKIVHIVRELYEFPAIRRDVRIALTDTVNSPTHYTSANIKCTCGKEIECIDVVENLEFNAGNIIKYVWRHKHKNGLEDLKKARWYLERLIKKEEKKNET